MITFISIERGHANSGMMCGVMRELSDRQQVCPVVLKVVAPHAEVDFERLVDAFGLSIRLWMVRSGQIRFRLEELEELAPELGCKGSTAVRHDVGGEAMVSPDVVEVLTSQFGSLVGCLGFDEDCLLGEAVYNN